MKGDAAAQFGAGEDDEKKDDEKKDDAAEKSVKVADLGGVAELFRALSGASRTTGKVGLTSPAERARVVRDAAITDADNRGDHREVLRLSTLRMRQNAAAAGAPVDARLLAGSDFQLTPVSLRQPI